MATVRELRRPVELIENEWVTLSDGTRLAAKIWLPEGATENPVPAIFEFLPYRKGDGTVIRDELRYPYFAAHGYAGVRVDLRGSGESDGILDDEYSPQELADAVETIAWIAGQEWCTGSVGMTGISWGGFNALQVAALQPPALKAIITLCSTDDRYGDDVHYRGGAVEGLDMLHWSAYMLMANGQPPDPALVGERWREMWLARMDANEPLVATWLAHQRRDAYWKHGSVCEDYSAITCAVYAVGGWQDGYTNAIPRLLQNLSCPRKGLIGPWGHKFPHTATPGPAIGFLQESLRFWDQWLKDEDTGVMDEPMLRAYVHDSIRPQPTYPMRPGRWFADTAWPPPSATERSWYLSADGLLGDQPGAAAELRVSGLLATAIATSGTWCGEGAAADSPGDQRTEDGASLCFTSQPLAEPVSFLGFPRVALELASDRPVAGLCVRLCEVFADGASALVSRQILNLTHRDSDEHPEPMVPGQKTKVTVQLDANGHRFAAGSRIRVAISPNYWPWMWPAPEPVTLTIFAGPGCRLELPVLPQSFPEPPPFEEPEIPPPLPYQTLAVGTPCREVTTDAVAGTTRMRFLWESGDDVLLPTGMRSKFENEAVYSIKEGEPLSASVTVMMAIEFEREERDWMIRIETVSEMSCDHDTFRVTDRLDAFENGARVRAQTWHNEIPRDLG